MADLPYQVYLYVGPSVSTSPAGVTVVDVTPVDATVDAAMQALEASGITAADLRTKALFIAAGDPRVCAVAYAAACGFAGRRLDYTDTEDLVDARALHEAYLAAPDLGKPEVLPEVVQVGAGIDDPSVLHFPHLTELTADQVTSIRFARRCRLAIDGLSTREALDLLVSVCALRVRGTADRFPVLVQKGDPHVIDPDLDYPGVDLDAARRRGAELRRARRVDSREAVVSFVDLTPRQVQLQAAADTPLEVVLHRLGSERNEETGFWRCPRPSRHRNGDANPSTRVADNLVRCFRCDAEPVDSLRLVMDVLDLGPDDAAAWLLTEPSLS